ncbi:MAG: hypothetical protein C5S44_03970, partial [Candidatus Methanocomedens sp.]
PYQPPHLNIPFMLSLGVLTRGKYGRCLPDILYTYHKDAEIKTIQKWTPEAIK